MEYDIKTLEPLTYSEVCELKSGTVVLCHNPYVPDCFRLVVAPVSNLFKSKIYQKFDYFKLPKNTSADEK